MYRNNHIYKVYSERPADLFHFYSGIVMVGTLFATHHGGDGVSSYSTVERHGGDAMAERRKRRSPPLWKLLKFQGARRSTVHSRFDDRLEDVFFSINFFPFY